MGFTKHGILLLSEIEWVFKAMRVGEQSDDRGSQITSLDMFIQSSNKADSKKERLNCGQRRPRHERAV